MRSDTLLHGLVANFRAFTAFFKDVAASQRKKSE